MYTLLCVFSNVLNFVYIFHVYGKIQKRTDLNCVLIHVSIQEMPRSWISNWYSNWTNFSAIVTFIPVVSWLSLIQYSTRIRPPERFSCCYKALLCLQKKTLRECKDNIHAFLMYLFSLLNMLWIGIFDTSITGEIKCIYQASLFSHLTGLVEICLMHPLDVVKTR